MGRPRKVVVEEPVKKLGGRPKGAVAKKTVNRDAITRAKAIRLFCTECMNFQVKLINACSDPACPLWCFRKGAGQEHTDIQLRQDTWQK